MKKNVLFSMLCSLAALVALALVWIIAYYAFGNEYLLPSLWDTVAAAGKLLAEAVFWRAFGFTLLRTLIAFLCSFVLGVGLAVLASLHGAVRAFLAPVISVLRTVPTMAIILILVLWTNRTFAPALVAMLVLLPAVYVAALASIDEVRQEYGDLAKAFQVEKGRKIFKMYLPLAAPNVLSQSGAILSMGLKITVSGEVLAQTLRSLGYLMQEAQMYLEMPRLLALTVLCVLIGFLLEGGGLLAQKYLVRWRQ